MDKRDNRSYEEVHKSLVSAMQEAARNDESIEYQTPQIDYSFMDAPKKKRLPHMSTFGKVAAILIIVLLGANVVMMASGSIDSYGEKGLLHRIHVGENGVYTDEEMDSNESDVDKTLTVRSMDDIEYAIDFMPGLYVPGYIPEGIEFKELLIKKKTSGDYEAIYFYSGELTIQLYWHNDIHYNIYSNNDGEYIELTDRKLLVYADSSDNDMYVVDVYTDNYYISITGQVSKDELIKIGKCLYSESYK